MVDERERWQHLLLRIWIHTQQPALCRIARYFRIATSACLWERVFWDNSTMVPKHSKGTTYASKETTQQLPYLRHYCSTHPIHLAKTSGKINPWKYKRGSSVVFPQRTCGVSAPLCWQAHRKVGTGAHRTATLPLRSGSCRQKGSLAFLLQAPHLQTGGQHQNIKLGLLQFCYQVRVHQSVTGLLWHIGKDLQLLFHLPHDLPGEEIKGFIHPEIEKVFHGGIKGLLSKGDLQDLKSERGGGVLVVDEQTAWRHQHSHFMTPENELLQKHFHIDPVAGIGGPDHHPPAKNSAAATCVGPEQPGELWPQHFSIPRTTLLWLNWKQFTASLCKYFRASQLQMAFVWWLGWQSWQDCQTS